MSNIRVDLQLSATTRSIKRQNNPAFESLTEVGTEIRDLTSEMKRVTIFCDGACEGNPGPGGWAAIIIDNQNVREIGGGVPATTNNKMELQAAIEALRALEEPCEVQLFTDSEYVGKGISIWINNWKVASWRNSARKSVKNQELWRELDAEAARHRITWEWVKGHAGNDMNELCDSLAKSEILKIRQQLTSDELKLHLESFKQRCTYTGDFDLFKD